MTIHSLQNGTLRLMVSEQGGVIEGFWHQDMPLLRPGKQSGVATESACFPLVPFGNRISGNHFTWEGTPCCLEPNVAWDRHYLHGDGWLAHWTCGQKSKVALTLAYRHNHGVYRYFAQQRFTLGASSLTVTLSVKNEGRQTLPFGLGWHPYFPLTRETRLQAQATGYWLEREQWLAGEYQDSLPAALNFQQPNALPRQWVNNGFAGWNGEALISQQGYSLQIKTTPAAPCYFVFVSAPEFEEGYAFDAFCFEPMSHAPDDHHRPRGGHLTPLKPGESFSQTMVITLQI
ncbi:aldose 1-epimerase [Yokenella regensburgei]|uniref:aldose 1-epimerase n=1 Tax=Yokenella regensburgei TaxID=158877 RepID=UPI003F15F7F6